jgi:hypothetical protein
MITLKFSDGAKFQVAEYIVASHYAREMVSNYPSSDETFDDYYAQILDVEDELIDHLFEMDWDELKPEQIVYPDRIDYRNLFAKCDYEVE